MKKLLMVLLKIIATIIGIGTIFLWVKHETDKGNYGPVIITMIIMLIIIKIIDKRKGRTIRIIWK